METSLIKNYKNGFMNERGVASNINKLIDNTNKEKYYKCVYASNAKKSVLTQRMLTGDDLRILFNNTSQVDWDALLNILTKSESKGVKTFCTIVANYVGYKLHEQDFFFQVLVADLPDTDNPQDNLKLFDKTTIDKTITTKLTELSKSLPTNKQVGKTYRTILSGLTKK
jgi:hypothetical protein